MIEFVVKYDGLAPGMPRMIIRRAQREAFAAIGEKWHREYREKHFTHAGAAEYGYTPRKGADAPRGSKEFRRSYTYRKFRKFGHTYPLVFTGASQAQARSRDVRATFNRVRVVLRTPTLNLRPRGGRINLRAELTTISDREARELVALFDKRLEERANWLFGTHQVAKRLGRVF